MNITDRQSEYCEDLVKRFNSNGLRAKTDLRNEKIGFKIREHTLQRVPYLIVVGDKEVEQQQVAVRTRTGDDLGVMSITDFEEMLHAEVARRSRKQ
jgi:threonyl-tRNA synthetase